jgi:hypothetical protein
MAEEEQGVDINMKNNALFNLGIVELDNETIISPPSLTANTNNYNPVGLDRAHVIKISVFGSGPNLVLTGIQAPQQQQNRFLYLVCTTTGRAGLDISNNDLNSNARNRFLTTSNLRMNNGDVITFWYDGAIQRWRVLSFI